MNANDLKGSILAANDAVDPAVEVDHRLVDETVSALGAVFRKMDEAMDEMGDRLLDELFGGDPFLYEKTHRQSPALKKVYKSCGSMSFSVSYSYVYHALKLAAFRRRLPRNATFNKLSSRHRIELARLGSPDKAESFAKRVMLQQMHVNDVTLMVAEARGRKYIEKLPFPLEQLQFANDLAEATAIANDLKPEDFVRMKPSEREALMASMNDVHERSREMMPLLLETLEERRHRRQTRGGAK